MESSTDHYLHKKFKKQLSIEPRSQQHNDKENKDSIRIESREEKTENGSHDERKSEEKMWNSVRTSSDNQRVDNNDSVPNQSTNQHKPSFSHNSIFSKSSISVENCEVVSTAAATNQQSSNSCISYVISNHTDEPLPTSFDTKFSDQPTNYSVSASSILDDIYSRQNYVNSEDMYHNSSIPYNLHRNVQDYSQKTNSSEEPSDSKLEEIHPPPDKNSSGKYVCPYCSLVCSKPSVLQKHIRAHTNERPYPCKSCGFSFKTRSNLYKHCRSRTHANRVMGNKTQDPNSDVESQKTVNVRQSQEPKEEQTTTQKPYKPRFHTAKDFFVIVSKDIEDDFHNNRYPASEMLTQHINEIISKNNCIVNDSPVKKRINEDCINDTRCNQNEPSHSNKFTEPKSVDEPLNLTNKNRKRSLSEVTEPVIQKSLIKELLLKNLSASDMQCPHCKMIFQTVTELDVHKYRSCKGNPAGAKYTRSSSVNVASILTQNKNAFDNIPHLQNTVFPLSSPGPFLGKTRLVDGDKSKSFSFDNCNMPLKSPNETLPSPNYLLSPLSFDKEKKTGLKLFGGEVKVQSSGETKSFKIDDKDEKYQSDSNNLEYCSKLSENRVIKSSLQSGGTVLTNKTNYSKHDMKVCQEVIRVYENTLVSPSIDITNFGKSKFAFERQSDLPDRGMDSMSQSNLTCLNDTQKLYSPQSTLAYKYTNIMDFSQKAVQKMTPNIKQPNFTTTSIPITKYNITENKSSIQSVECDPIVQNIDTEVEVKKPFLPSQRKLYHETKPTTPTNLYNPLKLLVNGKVVRHVPGMPGPVAPDSPVDVTYGTNIIAVGVHRDHDLTPASPLTPKDNFLQPEKVVERLNRSPKLDVLEIRTDFSPKLSELKVPVRVSDPEPSEVETKKFIRPNSLALKPSTASLKQHHGLTPTKFNQILISPDTPRVAKKYAELFLHGNYFSYLGLKSSTKPVYCTLNKTQPFYVHHFKKLSMYSEWRQQDTKQDKLYVSNYDSRQKSQRYSVAGKTTANLIIHSSYKFMVSELPSAKCDKDDQQKAVLGGYECNDDYTYIRGRGRGRYVCDQCGIRCKKPSMLKKHIRTHSNDRPYTCSHCNFSFKTKGNLTKHMKSKAHTKNYTASGSSGSSTQQSVHSSDSDTEDSGMDSSDESTRQQEHEAAYGLLSLSQKPAPSSTHIGSDLTHLRCSSPNDLFMSSEEIAYVSKTNYAMNKILDERNSLNFTSRKLDEMSAIDSTQETVEVRNVTNFLGKCSVNRPLTYPYTSVLVHEIETPTPNHGEVIRKSPNVDVSPEPKSIKQFHVIQKYMPQAEFSPKIFERPAKEPSPRKTEQPYPVPENVLLNNNKNINLSVNRTVPTLKLNDVVITTEKVSDLRKRKFTTFENLHKNKIQRNDEVMDLSMATVHEKLERVNGSDDSILNNIPRHAEPQKNVANEIYNTLQKVVPTSPQGYDINEDREENISYKSNDSVNNNGTVIILRPLHLDNPNINYADRQCNSDDQTKISEYDNSAMETLADIATKQVKLEKNMLAKSVATEFLKLATKNENMDGCRESGGFSSVSKDVNDIIVKSEGNKSCTICSKSFNKPSQLRLHMNIHYLERPFRCESCSVSFRTKGHLQKHERSAGHHTKLSSSPAMSTSEPRPFKCTDCNIAFRIHGHLAKHLRSKLHIMKLECLAKIPFGLYAELERSNSLLTEINTCDGDQCLESLKILAKKVFINDPNKLNHLEITEHVSADC